jgi:hypothetical protein
MKENFIELTNGKNKVLVNLLTVAKIEPYRVENTKISFSIVRNDNPYTIVVDESYDEVKKLMGLTKKEARVIG